MHTTDSSRAELRLRARLRAFAAGPDLLIDLMGFGSFAEMAMTRDGHLVARPRRSTAFDRFIGRPTRTTRRRVARVFSELRSAERALVLKRLDQQGINPLAIGIPADLVPLPTGGLVEGLR